MTEQDPNHIQSCYDAVAAKYAERYGDELNHKPLDRKLLDEFATGVGVRGLVYDLGCGPGQTTAYLHSRGVRAVGIDISDKLLSEAKQRHPTVPFERGDMLDLPQLDCSAAGVVAFYAIVHFTKDQFRRAAREISRILQPGGSLLLAFHIGHDQVHVNDFLGFPVALSFNFFIPNDVADELAAAGFVDLHTVVRDPYPEVEYPSRRAYVFARKRG